jgi:hypothetical protein
MNRQTAMQRYAGRVVLSEDDLVGAFKALGHPTRLAILGWLKDPASFPPQDQRRPKWSVSA